MTIHLRASTISSAAILAKVLLAFGSSTTALAESYPQLEACYNNNQGQIEKTTDESKETIRYKEPADLNAACNTKVLNVARDIRDQAKLRELAGIIGRNSNWGAAVPVYALAAKADPKRAICADKDVGDALALALARPSDEPQAKNGMALMASCWPVNRAALNALLAAEDNAYTKEHLCEFLQAHHGVSASQRGLCPGK